MLMLEAVARQLEIEVTDQEVEGRLTDIARENNMNVKQVKAQFIKEGCLDYVRHDMKQDKALDAILEKQKSPKGLPPSPNQRTIKFKMKAPIRSRNLYKFVLVPTVIEQPTAESGPTNLVEVDEGSDRVPRNRGDGRYCERHRRSAALFRIRRSRKGRQSVYK